MTEGWCYGTMSVSAQSKGHYCQRGLWEMTPEVLLLILALTACLTEPDFEDWENNTKSDTEEQEQDQLNIFIIIAVGLTLALLLTAFVATYLLKCRRTRKKHTDCEKEDPYLDDDIGEKVPMPMFEDDMPSVMELEMEDFEKWMIKEGNCCGASIESEKVCWSTQHPTTLVPAFL
ncbi:transmembrane protein 154 precursor [Silurus meridionalis]|nr:transmembrane protein 154 precursor [Silurus meridionalis]